MSKPVDDMQRDREVTFEIESEGARTGRTVTVCLLSGGIDSTVSATIAARDASRSVYLLSIFYGQGAERSERLHTALVADWLMSRYENVREHFILEIGSCARVSKDGPGTSTWSTGFVGWRSPRRGWEMAGYPSTRDETFTLMAAAGVEARLRDDPDATGGEVVLSTNADDIANFPDLDVSNFVIRLQGILDGKHMPSSGKPIKVRLPLATLTKAEVLREGKIAGAPLHLTWSCYFGEPDNPCRSCDQCRWRERAFSDAGLQDPTMRTMSCSAV